MRNSRADTRKATATRSSKTSAGFMDRWRQRTDAAFDRMCAGKTEEELVTLEQREDMAMIIAKEMAAFLLEENIARTAGSIGESVAAGAIFTLPAFVISHAWPSFGVGDAYWKSTMLMMVGSIVGVLFVSLVRRGMVEDPELPFPESVAAAEIHKAGSRGAEAVNGRSAVLR